MPVKPSAVIAALLLTAACRGAARPAIEYVGITVVPDSAGEARYEVRRDGLARGSHLSGDAVPFVHQAAARLERAAVDSLWALAEALRERGNSALPPGTRGFVTLMLTFADTTVWTTSWANSGSPPDAHAAAVHEWLMAHRIGGW